MKNLSKFWICTLAILGVVIFLASSCAKKDDNSTNPTVTTITDKDGNVYHSVTIGTQVWMVENLKTTKYNDGTAIPFIPDSIAWTNLTTPGYCWYKNDINNKSSYGALYNWFTVNTGKLAPTGWHIPTQDEWLTLITYVGGVFVAGGKLKEKDTIHWVSPNVGATDDYGFKALGGGYRNADTFYESAFYTEYRTSCCFWSTSELSAKQVSDVELSAAQPIGSIYSMYKNWGISVRCIKN